LNFIPNRLIPAFLDFFQGNESQYNIIRPIIKSIDKELDLYSINEKLKDIEKAKIFETDIDLNQRSILLDNFKNFDQIIFESLNK
jgi:hypothetical protein